MILYVSMLTINQHTGKLMEKGEILNLIPTPEFDYTFLSFALKDYRYPRNKIGDLIRSKKIIRVKKGIYVKAGSQYSKFVLANMIFGPSYISEDSALSYYGLIPEQVYTVTSMTCNRKKYYETPIGVFSYNVLPIEVYSTGFQRISLDSKRAFLIATPEKALVDRLWRVKGLDNLSATKDYLFMNMRFSENTELPLSVKQFRELFKISKHKFITHLIEIFSKA